MGVYIKGMEMPEHCGVCRFAVDGWCYAYGKPNIDALANDGRTNFCPLVPVPPHGRLIDADYLNMEYAEESEEGGWVIPCDALCEVPVIIPAEEGET